MNCGGLWRICVVFSRFLFICGVYLMEEDKMTEWGGLADSAPAHSLPPHSLIYADYEVKIPVVLALLIFLVYFGLGECIVLLGYGILLC